jgi:hypothetical protein
MFNKKGVWARDNKNGNSHAGALCCAADGAGRAHHISGIFS